MEPRKTYEVVILGAGLTGLSASFQLKKQGISHVILEAQAQAGGVLQSQSIQGYTLDHGANSMALNPQLEEMIRALKLEDHLLKPQGAAAKRLILRKGRLHEVNGSPLGLLKTSLISGWGKLRLLSEPFRKAQSRPRESVESFFTRRLGREAYQYLAEPILTGIYAGDGQDLLIEAILPKLKRWEQEHGSLFTGMRKSAKASKAQKGSGNGAGRGGRVIASFQGGMGQFIQALADYLSEELRLNQRLIRLRKGEQGFELSLEQGEKIQAKQVIWTLPSNQIDALELPELAPLPSLTYPPMMMVYLGYEQASVPRPLDSFGFLAPRVEQEPFLGCIWNSAIFSGKAPEGEVLFTLLIGGAHHLGKSESEFAEMASSAQRRFEWLMGIQEEPVLTQSYFWPQSIPQFNGAQLDLKETIAEISESYPGLHFAGNWLRGVSVGDCAKAGFEQAEACASRIKEVAPS
ncbi:MAG: protoporphyrinogen oxidase [Bacteroidota bacterium]